MLAMAELLGKRWCRGLSVRVSRHEEQAMALPTEKMPERMREFGRRRREGAGLDVLLPEVYALVREACRRSIGIRQYAVQVEGAAALSQGRVIEMNTGEGKTFVAALAAALYALDRRGVHVITANDYLAGRDHGLLRSAFEMLGLSAGVVLADTPPAEREEAYRADVTYTTVPQLGFDFLHQYFQGASEVLRTHDMWGFLHSDIDGSSQESRALRGRYCAILDEVDSVLIDYGRKPLSISVPAETQWPMQVYRIARQFILTALNERDFSVDTVRRKVELKEDGGKRKAGQLAQEYRYHRLTEGDWEERVEEALAAEFLYRKGQDYVTRDGEVVLVDQTSGRLMLGQRLGGELHQALEAKEEVAVLPRQKVAKKVTIQSLIRPYRNLGGMTGTAWEARREFNTVYDMRTVRFAPRVPLRRARRPDLFYANSQSRWEGVAEDVVRTHGAGQPVLVGTRSVEGSQRLSELLKRHGVPHELLNAVDHSREAEIIACAGQKGSVTVATRMAGRGVEIPLGKGVAELGGLRVIGSERHLVGRLDRQLGGRCGRRGQPGSIQFYASLEDDVVEALPERRRKRLRRRYQKRGRQGFTSRRMGRIFGKAQATFAEHYARVRRSLLARDLAEEKADRALFGQENL